MVEMVQTTTLSKGDTYVPDKRLDSFVIASYLSLFITLVFVIINQQILHWFIVPVTLCGILVSVDAVDWLRGRADTFDPAGIIGVFGIHFFQVAPLLHVTWDQWLPYAVLLPEDWRPWLGGMAILNLLGLILYRITRAMIARFARPNATRTVWQVNKKPFFIAIGMALILAAVLQIAVYMNFGGLSGYIASYETRYENDAFRGMGVIFMFSESFPILALMGFAVSARLRREQTPRPIIILVILLFAVLTMFFGGLRGLRSTSIWAIFWAAGILHYWIRPMSKRLILMGLLGLIVFTYLYGFYKGVGLTGVKAAWTEGENVLRELETDTGRSFQSVALGDFGRSDVQAYLLYRLTKRYTGYTYAMGRTYLGATAILIPRSVWPERPPTKVKEGTEVLYDVNSFNPNGRVVLNVYGLAGETMLNFGPYAVPFAFIVFGLVVGMVRHWILTKDTSDIRLLLAPFLVSICVVTLMLDSENVLFHCIKKGFLPTLVTLVGSKKVKVISKN